MSDKRIIATFIPQAWVDDESVDIDGWIDFDVTDQILSMGRDAALRITDNSYQSDDLWYNHEVIPGVDPHNGPFRIQVAAAIREYYEVD